MERFSVTTPGRVDDVHADFVDVDNGHLYLKIRINQLAFYTVAIYAATQWISVKDNKPATGAGR